MTVGGGIEVYDVRDLLRAGADKVANSTAAVENPTLIKDVSRIFGSQCMVLSLEAKKQSDSLWEVYTNSGRERTNLNAVIGQRKLKVSVGEILTSIDAEGTKKGFDLDLTRAITEAVNIPVIASGGMGKSQDLIDVVNEGGVKAVAMADILIMKEIPLWVLKMPCGESKIPVRISNE